MKKLFLSAAMAVAAPLALASPAHAAAVINFDGTTGTFGNTGIGAGAFSDTLHFNVPGLGSVGATISSIAVSLLTNVDFTSVTLNGVEFNIDSMGMHEFRTIVLPVSPGQQELVISGTSGGAGSYSGTLAFAVPEPATWAMMISGFGIAGAALRARRRKRPAALAAA